VWIDDVFEQGAAAQQIDRFTQLHIPVYGASKVVVGSSAAESKGWQ
jgi:hypothetical protein